MLGGKHAVSSLDLAIYYFGHETANLMSSVYIFIETCFYKHLLK